MRTVTFDIIVAIEINLPDDNRLELAQVGWLGDSINLDLDELTEVLGSLSHHWCNTDRMLAEVHQFLHQQETL